MSEVIQKEINLKDATLDHVNWYFKLKKYIALGKQLQTYTRQAIDYARRKSSFILEFLNI